MSGNIIELYLWSTKKRLWALLVYLAYLILGSSQPDYVTAPHALGQSSTTTVTTKRMSFTDTTNTWASNTPSSMGFSEEQLNAVNFDDGTDDAEFVYPGDYSSHMEELFEDEEPESHIGGNGLDEEDEGEEAFVYDGIDASNESFSYRAQLRDVLGQDHSEEESDVLEGERSLVHEEPTLDKDDELLQYFEDRLEHSPSTSSIGLITPSSRISTLDPKPSYFKLARPHLRPTVSRLRSYTPQPNRISSNASAETSHSRLFDGTSPVPSLSPSISRVSSISNFPAGSSEKHKDSFPQVANEVFRWTTLQGITQTLFSQASHKASSLLGAPVPGSPTTLVANGLICIGTSEGKVMVYDYKQSPICICESKIPVPELGAVTALALSHDHTFVVSGHATGHILLYNLKSSHNPVRVVPPTTLNTVLSGKKEGHLVGSRIVSVGFVAGRHTAIISADDSGLAFFHSLGKVFFVEASDILRILGRYPDDTNTPAKPVPTPSVPRFPATTHTPQKRRTRFTVLAMAPLPLGTAPHTTDNYSIVALLTPTKLVIVGLKPTPRTWFKCPREVNEGGSWNPKSKSTGALAWFPSVLSSGPTQGSANIQQVSEVASAPMLAYSWGSSLHLLRATESTIKQLVKNPKSSKTTEVEIGIVTHESFGRWSMDSDILAIQWLNVNQILIVTSTKLCVYDVRTKRPIEKVDFVGLSLLSPIALYGGSQSSDHDKEQIAHSVRVYKGKVFLLYYDRIVVGTLLTWADRILSLVQAGNLLAAVELARSYYVGEAPGNRNNLPEDPSSRKQVIGEKLRSLMEASSQYAFSAERMTDSTHTTPDNRGVDRTDLFEGLVGVCCRACISLGDTEFLFEELFQSYDESGISSIYLRQLEPFILTNEIHYVPPRITQRLVALHADGGRPDLVESIIWHIDPSCLDINQAIRLCQQYHLYDALIYVYTRALRDYVAPIVELLALIRRIHQHRRSDGLLDAGLENAMEPVIVNAYKIYPYMANILSGLTYPSEEPLDVEQAFQAKKDIYTFLFFGRSSVWPPGDEGRLVLTTDEEDAEPTYPYARQLLLFDSESFLHSLDIAFEDGYLNDESQTVNRLIIIRILIEILSTGPLPQEDATFIYIFIARNVPKYPQFLQLAPSMLHSILIGLAQDSNPKTREDRQLAAEYLLSIYNPHDVEQIVGLFENAGFYRILRTWYSHEHKWAHLLSTYIDDPDFTSLNIFDKIEDVVIISIQDNNGSIPGDLIRVISESLPRLLQANIAGTAVLVDRYIPDMHDQVLEALGGDENRDADHDQFEYLQTLVRPQKNDDDYTHPKQIFLPSAHLSKKQYQTFLTFQCQFHPDNVISTLQYLSKDSLGLHEILSICESNEIYDAVVWATNWQGEPQNALSKADLFQKRLCRQIVDRITPTTVIVEITAQLEALQSIGRVSRDICLERSQYSSTLDVPLEDIWFQLLSSQIQSVQTVSGLASHSEQRGIDGRHSAKEAVEALLLSLRGLVQATFGSLVSITSTSAVSFPRLFKRLVNSAPHSTGGHYTEFRTILTSMLESYRSDEDILIILKHLIERDLFETIAASTRERGHGWSLSRGTCQYCRKPLLSTKNERDTRTNACDTQKPQLVVSRSGIAYHRGCRPQEPN